MSVSDVVGVSKALEPVSDRVVLGRLPAPSVELRALELERPVARIVYSSGPPPAAPASVVVGPRVSVPPVVVGMVLLVVVLAVVAVLTVTL